MKPVRTLHPRVERVFDCDTQVGESPIWEPSTRRLFWVDIPAGTVFSGDPLTGHYRTRDSAGAAGSLALCQSGDLLVAAGDRLRKWPMDLRSAAAEPVAAMPPCTVACRFNDGKAGPDGRFWVGTVDPRPDRLAVGAIHGMGARGNPILLAESLLVPNGIAWAPRGDRMIFSDSGRGKVWSLPFEPAIGPLAEPSLWLDWRPDDMGMPDGAAMDEEGCYWSCGIFKGAIHRFDPSGNAIERYELPISQPTMCCFGGTDLKTLFVTSMTLRLSQRQRAEQPLAGKVVAFRVGVAGSPVGKFG